MTVEKGLAQRLSAVGTDIAAACRRAGRDPDAVTLVAASKTVPAEGLAEAIAAGHTVFGENRVPEAKTKWPHLRASHSDVELHLIGPLQSNKAREAVAVFDVIQSLDRASLAAALAKQCQRQDRQPEVFIQVNTGAETQKAGVSAEESPRFIDECREVHGLRVRGLMCIPPVDEAPEKHFAILADLAERHALDKLSMGMSADYALAVEYGATHVRVGSAIFGARSYPQRDGRQ